MKVLYFDCFSGISGDMTLAALLDVGNFVNPKIDEKYLIQQLNTLNLDGWEIKVNMVNKNGIEARNVDVILEDLECGGHSHNGHEHDHNHHNHHNHHDHNHGNHVHRTYRDIVEIIDKSGITLGAKTIGKRIFERLAIAEGKVHGKLVDEVHFHEVGAMDSIIDIVGVSILIDAFNVDKIYSSVVNDGHGFVRCQHGLMPIPVPAVVGVFANCQKARTKQIDIEKELITPTGAAIIAELADDFCLIPQMEVETVGYGSGKRNLEIPNVLRITFGKISENSQEITILETNIDDCTGEILGYVMEVLFQKGALDVFYTNIIMKKNRPAVKLTVLCENYLVKAMEDIIFRETTTIGIRKRMEERTILARETKNIKTPYGELKVKVVMFDGNQRISPEYDSAKILAEKNNVPIKNIYDCL